MNKHRLKTNLFWFQCVRAGLKTFEIRRNDRDYKIGDTLILEEYDAANKKYTGNAIEKKIVFMISKFEGLKEGWCVLGIEDEVMHDE